MTSLRQRMIDDLRLRNRSPRTIESYISAVAAFAAHFKTRPDQLGAEHVRQWLLYLIEEKKAARSSVNVAHSALKFFYCVTLQRQDPMEAVPLSRRPRSLPRVLSPEQVRLLLDAIREPRYRLMAQCAYAAGLRLTEITRLRVDDIDSHRMLIRVRDGKGGKDRYTILSPQLLSALRQYWSLYRPKTYLFPSPKADAPMDESGLQRAVRAAVEQTGLPDGVSVHTLRHCFATHMLEAGTSLPVLQKLMGHSDLKTTALYTHVSPQTVEATSGRLDLLNFAPKVSQ